MIQFIPCDGDVYWNRKPQVLHEVLAIYILIFFNLSVFALWKICTNHATKAKTNYINITPSPPKNNTKDCNIIL